MGHRRLSKMMLVSRHLCMARARLEMSHGYAIVLQDNVRALEMRNSDAVEVLREIRAAAQSFRQNRRVWTLVRAIEASLDD